MFTIYAKTGDENPVVIDDAGEFDPRYAVKDPEVTEEVNKAGTLQFTVYPNHFYYDRFIKMATTIWVIEDDLCIFYGRVLYTQKNLKLDKIVYCEGALSYLLDTFVDADPVKSMGMALAMADPPLIDSTVEEAMNLNFSVKDFVRVLLSLHNSQLGKEDQHKRISYGSITVNGNSEKYRFDIDGINKTANFLMENLVEQVGGYIHVRVQFLNGEARLFLDWGNEVYSVANTQDITFGSNLIDYSSDESGIEMFTVLYPIGKPINDSVNNGKDFHFVVEEEDQRDYWMLDGEVYYEEVAGATKITGEEFWVVDGTPYTNYVEGGLHVLCSADGKIYIPEGIAQYGRIYKSVELSNMTSANDMLNKALAYAERRYDPLPEKISVTALDLKKLYPQESAVHPLKYGTKIRVISEIHGIDRSLICISLTHNLRSPSNNSYTLSSELNDKLDNVPIFSNDARSSGRSYGGGGGSMSSSVSGNKSSEEKNAEFIEKTFKNLKKLYTYLNISSLAILDDVSYESHLLDNQRTFKVIKKMLFDNDLTDTQIANILKELGLVGDAQILPDGTTALMSDMQFNAAGLAIQTANQNTILSYLEAIANQIGMGVNDGQGNRADMTIGKDQNGRHVIRFDVGEGTEISGLPQNTSAYSSAETYDVGDCVLYSGHFYKCKTAVTEPEAFNPVKWELDSTVEEGLYYYLRDGGSSLQQTANSVKSVVAGSGVMVDADGHIIEDEDGNPRFIGDEASAFSDSLAYSTGDYVKHNGKVYRFTSDHAAGAWNDAQVEEVVSLYSKILQNADEINLRVTQGAMNSALILKADSATLSTVRDVNGNVTAASIATAINNDNSSQAIINADHVYISGTTTLGTKLSLNESGGLTVSSSGLAIAGSTNPTITIANGRVAAKIHQVSSDGELTFVGQGSGEHYTLDTSNVPGILTGASVNNNVLTVNKVSGGSAFTIQKSGSDLIISDGTGTITFNKAVSLSGGWNSGIYSVTATSGTISGTAPSTQPHITLSGNGSTNFSASLYDNNNNNTGVAASYGYLHQSGNSVGVYTSYSGGSYGGLIASIPVSGGDVDPEDADIVEIRKGTVYSSGTAVIEIPMYIDIGVKKPGGIDEVWQTRYVTESVNITSLLDPLTITSSGTQTYTPDNGIGFYAVAVNIPGPDYNFSCTENVATWTQSISGYLSCGAISKSSISANTYLRFRIKCDGAYKYCYITVNP